MENQLQLSEQALLVASLLDDVKAAEQGLGGDLTSKMVGATRLIEGDLSLAQREARKLSGTEAQIFISMATQMEARLRYGYLGNTFSAEGKAELRKAAQLAESAISRFASAECYLLLSGIYAELGDVGKAREALNMASHGDFGEIDVNFKKSLVRHEEYLNQIARGSSRQRAIDQNTTSQVKEFVTKHAKPMRYVLASFILYFAVRWVPNILFLRPVVRISWFFSLCIGIFLFLKELITKKPS